MLVVVVAALGFAPSQPIRAQQPAPTSTPQAIYHEKTGHNVYEPFASYFQNNGGLERFGFAITEAFIDSKTGLRVQYFQKARMEEHPENAEPYKVQLGLLGEELQKKQPPIAVTDIPAATDPNCHYFKETGHKVCYAFLEYWKKNGGLDAFGYPIGPMMIEGGRTVQYFQRARMDWYPEYQQDRRVQLADLGRTYYDYANLPQQYLNPVPDGTKPAQSQGTPAPTSLRVRVSVASPFIAKGGLQSVTVTVTDQFNKPVAGAAVSLVVGYATGSQTFNATTPTNATGSVTFTFPAGNRQPVGTLVLLTATATYNTLSAQTTSSYMIWWW